MREETKEKRGDDRKRENTYKTSIIVRKNISKNKFSLGTFVSLRKDCLNKKNKSFSCKIEMRKDKGKIEDEETKRRKKS